MAKDEIFVGLEIGTTKVCAVVAEGRRDGSTQILGVGQAPSRGVRKGEIVDLSAAQKSAIEAINDAEERTDVVINEVYVAVTGDHIESFNNRGSVDVPPERDEITDEDVRRVQAQAQEVSIPTRNSFLHTLIQHYHVDGKDSVLDPLGMPGRTLEADYHVVHGVRTRIQNTIRCVKEIPLKVLEVVFSPVASAQAVLTTNQKNLGALLIDIGGGTCSYVLYLDGVIKQSGCLPIGGDHISNDISLGLRIPLSAAERLKVEEGSAVLGNSLEGEMVFVKDETGLSGREVDREMLNTIIHLRATETFEILRKRLDRENALHYVGAGICLTGGTSLLNGLDHVASDVFGLPVHTAFPQKLSGVTSAWDDPRFSTAIGLVKYAQAMHAERRKDNLAGKLWGKLKGFWGG
jgi:cell division protein FtsA